MCVSLVHINCRIVSLHGGAWQREGKRARDEGGPHVSSSPQTQLISHHFVSAYRRFVRTHTHTPLFIYRTIRSRAGAMYPRCALYDLHFLNDESAGLD